MANLHFVLSRVLSRATLTIILVLCSQFSSTHNLKSKCTKPSDDSFSHIIQSFPTKMSSGSASEKLSPNKRLKTEPPNADGGGGGDQPVCCGICLAGRGASIAGEIDCCSHYFCFACIMEWAKHESRCPICRQRFSNVRRPPKQGVLSFSRDVKVPIRDQVYHPYGNMTTGPADSHVEAKCSICHGVTDENLLLLCDLCNTASHTYCAGLGYTVPEGDWFCYDCAISRETNADEESEQQQIVMLSVRRTIASSPSEQNQSSLPVIPSADRLSRYRGKRPLPHVQQVQRNIQALRDNWNALRSGSMKFHSNSVQTGGGLGCHERNSGSMSRGKSDEPHSMTSTTNQQSCVRSGHSRGTSSERSMKDVEKAWKMMDKAKKMQGTRQRTSRQ